MGTVMPQLAPRVVPGAAKAALQQQAAMAAMPAPSVSNAPVFAAPNALPIAASIPAVAPSQTIGDQNELHRLQSTGSGISQIQNPFIRGVARVADTVGQFLAPNLDRLIGGTELKHREDVGRQAAIVGQDQASDQRDSLIQDQQAQAQLRQSQAAQADSRAAEAAPFVLSADQAAQAGVPELAGEQMSARTYQRFMAAHEGNVTKQSVSDDKNDTTLKATDMKGDQAAERNAATNNTRESVAEAANKTRLLVQGMHDATTTANNQRTTSTSTANSVRAHGGGAAGDAGNVAASVGNHKVPADVTKRAALAGNVTENADAVEKLIAQRPDIVGAAGGRYTSIQQMIGSNDPAIAELGVRMHNIALASNGAHGVRAQGAIENTEKELFNHYKSGPQAIHGALQATRGSMQTFLDDERNFSQTGSRTQSAPVAKPAKGSHDIVISAEDLK